MRFQNLTPHAVTIQNGALKIVFEKDPNVPTARIEQVIEERTLDYEIASGMMLSIPVNAVTRTTVYNLPEPQEDVIYICSSMVATYVKRPDVVAPITDATCTRDTMGRVISVKGLQTFYAKSIDEVVVPVEPKPYVQFSWEEIDRIVDDVKSLALQDGLIAVDVEPIEEITEEIFEPVPKVDMDMMNPILAAQKMKAREKYMKRVGKNKRNR